MSDERSTNQAASEAEADLIELLSYWAVSPTDTVSMTVKNWGVIFFWLAEKGRKPDLISRRRQAVDGDDNDDEDDENAEELSSFDDEEEDDDFDDDEEDDDFDDDEEDDDE